MTHNANEFRKLAEAADGTRDSEVFFRVDGDKLKRSPDRPASGRGIIVETDSHGPGLRGRETLSVTHGTEPIPDRADAAFTSQSAFEKFVLPYYIRTRSVDELKVMLTRAYAKDVVCVFHDPDSETDTITGTGLGLIKTDGAIEFI